MDYKYNDELTLTFMSNNQIGARIGEHIFRAFYPYQAESSVWLNAFTGSESEDSASDVHETQPEWDGSRFHKVIRNLEQLSLVTSTDKYSKDTGAWFSVHPVIRDWLQIRMKSNLRRETLRESIYLVKTVTALEVTKVAGADVNQELLNHVDILVDPLKALCKCGFLDDVLVGDSAVNFGHFYYDNGHHMKAIELLEYALDVVRASSAADELVLRLEYTLALVYNRDRQSSKAIELLEHVVRVLDLEETHPHRLASQHELAIAYGENGQLEDAIKLLEHVVQVWQGIDEGHSHCLTAQHDLAITYLEDEQADRGIELLEHVVKVYERTKIAEDDSCYRLSRQELAEACQKRDRNTPATVWNVRADLDTAAMSSHTTGRKWLSSTL
ncbi:hypothetical protein D6C79_04597 [Aureobasidium pullulans]|nr:hypothetical protein D6C79_04597 [Aureobasidium pullulans]